jgi:signal transduction histidine kinase
MTDDLGGTIGFDSLEGSGSTFYVIFPKHAVSK